jgi:hypothetical protein
VFTTTSDGQFVIILREYNFESTLHHRNWPDYLLPAFLTAYLIAHLSAKARALLYDKDLCGIGGSPLGL